MGYNRSMNKVLLIIPAYNEAESILQTCEQIHKYNRRAGTHCDFIVINDSSNDSTEQILQEHSLPYISHIYNLGIGGAMQTGYKYALAHEYDFAVQFDGDGQHDISYLSTLLQPLLDNSVDMTIGSRFITKSGRFRSTFARRVGIKVISNFIKLLAGHCITDVTSGFRACNRKVIANFAHDYPAEYPEPVSTTDCLLKSYRIKEIPVEMNPRTAGASSIHSWKNIYYMVNVCLALTVTKIKRR